LDKYTVLCSAVMVRCSIVEAPEMVMQAKDLSKMMAKYKYRQWYMKIDAIISKHSFG